MLLVNIEVVSICHAGSKRQNHLARSAEASCVLMIQRDDGILADARLHRMVGMK